jgi:hypothetical protein
MNRYELPLTLEIRECANGETAECFLSVDGEPVYGPSGTGVFLTTPSVPDALRAALLLVLR